MTLIGIVQILFFFAIVRRDHQAGRHVHVPRFRRPADVPSSGSSARWNGCIYRVSGIRER